ncbi:MAG: hypothetical protein GDA66_07075 [Nitrospira sp. CR1.2]|nr:hypothetical protein [Nitrospira sp. CR1.2]
MSKYTFLIISILFLLIRVMVILWGGQHEAPGGDQLAFYSGAQKLAHSWDAWVTGGGEFGYRAPLYFVYLAGVFSLVPDATFLAGQLATALIGVLNGILTYRLVRNITGERVARVAFWLRGVVPSWVAADTFVMSEPFFATFLLSVLVVISQKPCSPDRRQALMLGFLIACCLLTREVAIFYPVVFGGYLYLVSRSWKEACHYVAWFALALVLTLSPWMWRNVIVWGQPLPLSYTSGVNLHIGNNPQATGKWVPFPAELEAAGGGFGTPQSDAWHRAEALKHMQEHPVETFQLGFKKVAWFLWPRFEREELTELYKLSPRQATIISSVLGMLSGTMLMLGVAGLVFGARDWFWWVSLMLIAYTLAVTFVVYGSPRYRDAVDCLLLVYAATVVVQWRQLWEAINTKGTLARRQLMVLVPIVSYILANWIWIAYGFTRSGH